MLSAHQQAETRKQAQLLSRHVQASGVPTNAAYLRASLELEDKVEVAKFAGETPASDPKRKQGLGVEREVLLERARRAAERVAELQSEYEPLSLELNEVLSKPEASRTLEETKIVHERRRTDALAAKHTTLASSLEALEAQSAENRMAVLPPANARREFYVRELSGHSKQVEEALSHVRQQVVQRQRELGAARKQLRQHEQLNDRLRQRLSSIKPLPPMGLTNEEQRAKIMRATRAMAEESSNLLRELSDFCQTYYPEGHKVAASGPRRKRTTDSGERDGDGAATLEDTIMTLMNKYLQDSDPYISLDGSIWQPYVELLVQAGIAEKHPSNAGKLRLVEFAD